MRNGLGLANAGAGKRMRSTGMGQDPGRERLDFVILLNERHLKMIFKEWESVTTEAGLTLH